jgi:N-acyl-phosphatidylethanolamine-hydrolysing phospholipase D
MKHHFDPSKKHHTKNGFVNNYLPVDIGSASLLKWQWQRFTQGLPKPPPNGYQFPLEKPDVAWLQANRSAGSATWIGHATMLLQLRGLNILTDPVFSQRAAPTQFAGPKRKVAPALSFEQLPHIDVVLISHNHYDHLDLASVLQLNRQPGGAPLFLVPLGIKRWMADIGISHVQELDWWQQTMVSGMAFHFVPVQHWSARSLTDRNKTLWGGWVGRATAQPDGGAAAYAFFFAGDTGYSKDFADIGEAFGGVDLALIPIGAYAPRWFMKNHHANPADSVKIHQDVKAKLSLAIHWGTFELTDEPLDEPPQQLAHALQHAHVPKEQFRVLRHGQMVLL